jgi:hypothetical protein
MQTTSRLDFAARDEADVVRSMTAAKELTKIAHKALLRSTITLGKTGLAMSDEKDWGTEYEAIYHSHPIDLRANHALVVSVKRMFTGPTASCGKVMPAK